MMSDRRWQAFYLPLTVLEDWTQMDQLLILCSLGFGRRCDQASKVALP